MIQNYFLNKIHTHAPKWLVFLIDLSIVISCYVAAYFIRFNLSFTFDTKEVLYQLPVIGFSCAISFLIVGSYKGIVRHTGIRDVYNIFNAICLSNVFFITILILNSEFLFFSGFNIPRSIFVIFSLLSFLFLTTSRYLFKYCYEIMMNNPKDQKNVVIYGAGESGVVTHNAIVGSAKNLKVIAYIDKDQKKVGKSINGVPVYAALSLTKDFVKDNDVKQVIFSTHKIDKHKLRVIVERLTEYPVKVKIVPPVEDWINGEFNISQIKNVQIEDLLDRPPISIENENVANEINGKVVLITGGAGSIGSEIARQVANYKYKSLIILDQAESALYDLQQELKQNGFHNFIPIVGDVRDKNRMNYIFDQFKPNVIFHAAAYKHVPLMEYNSYEAIKINIAGTKNIADLALDYNVDKFILISTDKAVNPTNVMGTTKRIAELYVSCLQKQNKTKFITTRFGNVLGSNGSVIPLFRKQIEKGGPLTVTHKDVTRYFMTIPEASQLVLEAGAMGNGGEIFIFDMGESVKIFDLAKNMIKLSGLNYPEDIDIKITGLRPGEKLYEELLANGEDTLPTYHKKIMISKARPINYKNKKSKIEELCVNNILFNDESMVKLMKEIVPEFISNNSAFEKFDHKSDKNKKFTQTLQ